MVMPARRIDFAGVSYRSFEGRFLVGASALVAMRVTFFVFLPPHTTRQSWLSLLNMTLVLTADELWLQKRRGQLSKLAKLLPVQ